MKRLQAIWIGSKDLNPIQLAMEGGVIQYM